MYVYNIVHLHMSRLADNIDIDRRQAGKEDYPDFRFMIFQVICFILSHTKNSISNFCLSF